MLKSPFLQELESARNVLVAGVGGGFDVFSGLPLYFGLQADGKQVHLANLSFSRLPPEPEARLAPAVLTVTASTPRVTNYFPEKHLCQWFRGRVRTSRSIASSARASSRCWSPTVRWSPTSGWTP